MERQNISPVAHSLLRNSQRATVSAERNFFMLKKLLAKNKNFKGENVTHYMVLHDKFSTW